MGDEIVEIPVGPMSQSAEFFKDQVAHYHSMQSFSLNWHIL
jgi:hypothetical protein